MLFKCLRDTTVRRVSGVGSRSKMSTKAENIKIEHTDGRGYPRTLTLQDERPLKMLAQRHHVIR